MSIDSLSAQINRDSGEEISEIADHYLAYVGGGLTTTFHQFMQYTQNTGDDGPHSGPFWEQVIRTYPVDD